MDRFYTHVCAGANCAFDWEGDLLADADAARDKALKGARELVAEEIRGGCNEVDLEFMITNAIGEPVALLPITATTTGLPET